MIKKLIIAFVILLAPLLMVLLVLPSQSKIVKKGFIKCPTVKDETGKSIDPYIVWGNIFSPKSCGIHGWDLIGIPMYYDPLTINETNRFIQTPVFHNALVYSTFSKKEFDYTKNHLIKAAKDNSEELVCLVKKDKYNTCEGDQINPYIWASFKSSMLHSKEKIKYLAGLPLFDPSALINSINSSSEVRRDIELKTRKILAQNVEYITERLIGVASHVKKVNSIAIPIMGSTSHKGGDSSLFLNFSKGAKSIYSGIKRSNSNYTFSKLYIVGFNLHKGVFKKEAIESLQNIWFWSFMDNLASKYYWILFAYYFVSFYIFLLLFYSNFAKNHTVKTVSRVNLFLQGVGISSFFAGLLSAALLTAIPNIYAPNIKIYFTISAACLILIFTFFLYLSKVIFKP